MPEYPHCTDEYERPGGREPGDRIVRCGLPGGHDGPHVEDETGESWTAKDDRERDSLARRLAIRFGEVEQARAALKQAEVERDWLLAEASDEIRERFFATRRLEAAAATAPDATHVDGVTPGTSAWGAC